MADILTPTSTLQPKHSVVNSDPTGIPAPQQGEQWRTANLSTPQCPSYISCHPCLYVGQEPQFFLEIPFPLLQVLLPNKPAPLSSLSSLVIRACHQGANILGTKTSRSQGSSSLRKTHPDMPLSSHANPNSLSRPFTFLSDSNSDLLHGFPGSHHWLVYHGLSQISFLLESLFVLLYPSDEPGAE